MTEFIFDVPDSNQPIAGDTALYYPDERDDPMMVCEEIVRCRDCKFADWDITAWWCIRDKHNPFEIGELRGYGERSHLYGFCAWGERRETTCKCGESIELGDREYAVCPSCGRTVRE